MMVLGPDFSSAPLDLYPEMSTWGIRFMPLLLLHLRDMGLTMEHLDGP